MKLLKISFLALTYFIKGFLPEPLFGHSESLINGAAIYQGGLFGKPECHVGLHGTIHYVLDADPFHREKHGRYLVVQLSPTIVHVLIQRFGVVERLPSRLNDRAQTWLGSQLLHWGIFIFHGQFFVGHGWRFRWLRRPEWEVSYPGCLEGHHLPRWLLWEHLRAHSSLREHVQIVSLPQLILPIKSLNLLDRLIFRGNFLLEVKALSWWK